MQIHFRKTDNEQYWVWTEGLQTLGQREIAVMVSWSEHDSRQKFLLQLLRFLEDYLRRQPKRILPGETLHYGWTTLCFVDEPHHFHETDSEMLFLEEIQAPLSSDPPSYIPGVAHTVALMQFQENAMRRNAVSGDVIYPHRSHSALVCTRIAPTAAPLPSPMMAHRAWQPHDQQSGWFVGCCDHTHDHNQPNELAIVHLYHLVEQFPALFPYLAMPVDTKLLFETDQVIVFRPDEENGHGDPEGLCSSYFDGSLN